MALQSSQRLPELLFYTKRSYKILQLQFQLQFQLQCYTCTLHYNPENSPSRIQLYMQKTKSSSSTTATFQRAKRPSFQERNSSHRRQRDLLEIHPCVLQDIQGNSSCSRDIPDIPVIHDLPAFQAILQCSSISRESTPFQHSPIRIHILHILQFYNSYSSIGFHRNSTEYQLGNYRHYKHSFFKEREMLRYRSN